MRNFKNILLIGISSFLLVFSCNSFESEPYEYEREEGVFDPYDSTATNIKQLFYAIYVDLPLLHTRFQSTYLDAATDDAVPTRDEGGNGSLNHYRKGSLSSNNIANLDGDAWKRNYDGIRKVNLFLKKIDGYPTSTYLSAKQIKEYIAEARAIRAYYYLELIKRWSDPVKNLGVPLLGDQILDNNSDINIPRSSLESCISYIVGEISPNVVNSCFENLTDAVSSKNDANTIYIGRMNKGNVLGLLSRLRLYMASPLYNQGNDISKWEEAAKAAKDLIDLNVYGLAPNIKTMFLDNNTYPSKEVIMAKQMRPNASIEASNSPSGYVNGTTQCKGSTSPSQNLVDAFLTKSGKLITDQGSGYDPQNPYANRDPRLEASIFCNESMWMRRKVETFEGGLDKADRHNSFYTQTGYYLRKFLTASENSGTLATTAHHYQIIRYAEILLNYAEALNEVSYAANQSEIENCIIQLRRRAGIEEGDGKFGLPATSDQTAMREIIRNERRIELAFEDHRFWDIRRWMIAEDVMNKPVRGVIITKQADGTFKYDYNVTVTESIFDKKMYSYPIPLNQLQGNSKLVQNSEWGY